MRIQGNLYYCTKTLDNSQNSKISVATQCNLVSCVLMMQRVVVRRWACKSRHWQDQSFLNMIISLLLLILHQSGYVPNELRFKGQHDGPLAPHTKFLFRQPQHLPQNPTVQISYGQREPHVVARVRHEAPFLRRGTMACANYLIHFYWGSYAFSS